MDGREASRVDRRVVRQILHGTQSIMATLLAAVSDKQAY
jgi:hypothetical protein